MEWKKISKKVLGTFYLLFAVQFGSMLLITFSYMTESLQLSLLMQNMVNPPMLYMMFYFAMSFIIGMLLLLKQSMSKGLVKLLLSLAAILALTDFSMILSSIWAFMTRHPIIPPLTLFGVLVDSISTLVRFAVHLYLIFELSTLPGNKKY